MGNKLHETQQRAAQGLLQKLERAKAKKLILSEGISGIGKSFEFLK